MFNGNLKRLIWTSYNNDRKMYTHTMHVVIINCRLMGTGESNLSNTVQSNKNNMSCGRNQTRQHVNREYKFYILIMNKVWILTIGK